MTLKILRFSCLGLFLGCSLGTMPLAPSARAAPPAPPSALPSTPADSPWAPQAPTTPSLAALPERFLDEMPGEAAAPLSEEERKDLYQDVPATSTLADLSLRACIQTTLDRNYTLRNARRDVELSQSRLRESEAFFVPFVDLISDTRYSETRAQSPIPGSEKNGPRNRLTQNMQDGRVQVGENLPTGGNLSTSAGSSRTRSGANSGPGGGNTTYESQADVRLSQPLLQGGGFDVGMADLRLTRLSQMNQEITYRLSERNILLQVIQQYFNLLQSVQDLRVGRDALAEKLRFLEETRIKYQVGRVAESEILRADLQCLQERENTVSRQQTFEDRRERLALTLGLETGEKISVQDITSSLARRGVVAIPTLNEAIRMGLASRLELRQTEIAYEQSRINLDVARNGILPQLDLSSGYTTSDKSRNLGTSTDLEDNNWDVGLGLKIPIPNIAKREALKRAVLSLEKTRTNWNDQERQIAMEIKGSHRAILSAESGLAILAKTVEQASKNLELINGSFEVGYSTITEVRLAQDDLFAAQSRYKSTLLNYQILIAQFYSASGQPLR